MDADTERRRRRGWWIGGLAGIAWLLPAALLATFTGAAGLALSSGGLFLAGLVYLLVLPPWRFPRLAFGWYYAGLVALILVAAALLSWQLAPQLPLAQRLGLLFPALLLFAPLLVFRRRTWDELGPVIIHRSERCS